MEEKGSSKANGNGNAYNSPRRIENLTLKCSPICKLHYHKTLNILHIFDEEFLNKNVFFALYL